MLIIYIISIVVVQAALGFLAYAIWDDQGYYNISNLGVGFLLLVVSFVPVLNTIVGAMALVLAVLAFFEEYGKKKVIGRK